MDKDKVFSRRWFTLFVLSIAVMITGLQNTMTNVGLPTLQSDYGANTAISQWFLNSYVLTFAGLLLLMGALGDKYGRKLMLNVGLLVFGAGSLWAVVASSSGEFISSQVLMGAGAAILTPQTLSIIVDVFKKSKERAMAIAIWTGIVALGAGMGPLIGGLLLENYSVNSLFLVNIPLILFVLIFGFFIVPESKKVNAPKVDLIGTVLSILAVVSLVTGFIWVPEHSWISLHVLGAFFVFVVAAVLFVKYEAVTKHPLVDLKYFKSREFIDGVIGVGVVFFNIMGVLYIATQYLQVVQQKSALDTGLLILPMAITVALASIIGQKFATKFGNSRTIMYGVFATAAGVLLVSFWSVDSPSWVVATVLSILGLGAGIAMAPATNSIMKPFPVKDAGIGSAMNTLARQVPGAIGIAVLGSALSARYSDSLQAYVTGAPTEIANQITGSIQGAFNFANELITQGQIQIANSVIATTSSAFMVGVGAAMALATIITIVIGVNIGRNTPKN